MNRLSFSKLFSALLLILPGCRDINFDLADVDLSVTVGGEFALPVGSLQEIKLGDILGLDGAGNAISTDKNGDYHIALDGSTASPEHRLGPSSISLPLNQSIKGEKIELQLPGFTSHIKYVSEVQQVSQNLSFSFSTDNFSELISDVRHIELESEFKVTAFFRESGLSSVNAYMQSGSRISFPAYLEIETDENEFYALDEDAHSFVFLKDMPTERTGTQMSFRLKGIDLSKAPEGQGFVEGRIVFNDAIKVDVGYFLSTDDLTDKGTASAQFELQIQSGKAKIGSVQAKAALEPDIKEIELDLSAARSFMGEDGVMDLDDLILYLDLRNDTPVSGNISADIICLKEGVQTMVLSLGKDPKMHLPANSTTRFCISEKAHNEEGCVNLCIPGLTDLLKNLPERICIGNYAIECDEEWISFLPQTSYSIGLEYKLDAPVAFGKDLDLVIEQPLDLNLDLGEKVQFNTVDLEMAVSNTTPLNFELGAVAIDSEGKPIDGIRVECNDSIHAGLMEAPQSSRTVIRIVIDNPQQKLAGLNLSLAAGTDPEHAGIALNKDQGLKMNDIVAHVIDGITIDLNKKSTTHQLKIDGLATAQ